MIQDWPVLVSMSSSATTALTRPAYPAYIGSGAGSGTKLVADSLT